MICQENQEGTNIEEEEEEERRANEGNNKDIAIIEDTMKRIRGSGIMKEDHGNNNTKNVITS